MLDSYPALEHTEPWSKKRRRGNFGKYSVFLLLWDRSDSFELFCASNTGLFEMLKWTLWKFGFFSAWQDTCIVEDLPSGSCLINTGLCPKLQVAGLWPGTCWPEWLRARGQQRCHGAGASSSTEAAPLGLGESLGVSGGGGAYGGWPSALSCLSDLIRCGWRFAKASTLRGVESGWRGRARPSFLYVLLKSSLCCRVCGLCPILEAVPLSLGFSSWMRWATLAFHVIS